MNLDNLFAVHTSLLELAIRGSVMHLLLLAALRVLVRRHVGSMSLMDLLLMVLIADAAQNAMATDYRSITEGVVLCGTLIGWNYFLDWLAYRSPFVQRLLEPAPLPVVRDGKFLRRNMRQEFITEDELRGQLREKGVDSIDDAQLVCIESDGGISVRLRGQRAR
ncbi:DUF421 domain-containing protein [Lacipirellula sp.]|uniref:DUF421 domain-containing protein n=1 Tax=Lacipirellula sp. TaxID=2691419 RepID=UPI003D0B8F6D